MTYNFIKLNKIKFEGEKDSAQNNVVMKFYSNWLHQFIVYLYIEFKETRKSHNSVP